MTKVVHIVPECDGARHDGGKRPTATVERIIRFDGEEVLLDVCDPDDTELQAALEVVREWVKRGTPVAKAQQSTLGGEGLTPTGRRIAPLVECPYCERKDIKSTGLTLHKMRHHPVELAEERARAAEAAASEARAST